MRRGIRNNKKGMSIVISTVIIIAITITMAIAVAFWAMGLGNSFTKFEKLEFVSIYADVPVVAPIQIGTTATAHVSSLDNNLGITGIAVDAGGSGYSSLIPPAITITDSGGAGSGARAHAIIQGGRVMSIVVDQPGSGYISPAVFIPTPRAQGVSSFPVFIQLQNSGQIAATINNVFLNEKPYTAYLDIGLPGGQNLVGTVLNVGVRNNGFVIYLPSAATPTTADPWRSGEYVEIEIETTSGKLYSNTVLLP